MLLRMELQALMQLPSSHHHNTALSGAASHCAALAANKKIKSTDLAGENPGWSKP
jgi:hypothetical protein